MATCGMSVNALESGLERAIAGGTLALTRRYHEIPMAKDLAGRVENLIGIPVADRIRELA